jgi:hypothetical protein
MIAAFNGISLPSKGIKWFGDGDETHVAWVDDDLNNCWEAWTSGVRVVDSIHHQHTPGTLVKLYRHRRQQHHHTTAIRQFLAGQKGKPYDWPGIFRFVTRGDEDHPDDPPSWFCSRLLAAAYRKAGIPILHASDWKIMPTHVPWSTDLVLVDTVRTVDINRLDNRGLMGCQVETEHRSQESESRMGNSNYEMRERNERVG